MTIKFNLIRGVLETNRDITVGEFMDLYNMGAEMDVFAIMKEPEYNYAEELINTLN